MSLFDTLFRRRDGSANAAKTRLLKVLVDDRYKLTPEMMAQLKIDLAEVFARYLPSIDPDSIDVTVQRGESNDHLQADIPLRRPSNT
jgi:cell division topological specificity factor